MATDPYGTDVESLVPMDLTPEPEGLSDAVDHPDEDEGDIERVDADLTGEPIPDGDDVLDVPFDEAADRALLTEEGGD